MKYLSREVATRVLVHIEETAASVTGPGLKRLISLSISAYWG
jgi:hypothetical protein